MNWKGLLLGVIFYVVLGTFFGNYFKAELGFILTVIIAFMAGVITALVSKKQFVRHGIWVGFLGGILISVILVIIITLFPLESRILFPSHEEREILRSNIQYVFLMTTTMFTIIGIIGSAIGSFITGLVYRKVKGEVVEKEKSKIPTLKIFFKPDKRKIILFIILILVIFLNVLSIQIIYMIFALPSFIITEISYELYRSIFPLNIMFDFIYLYTLSCFIIWIYNKLKK